MSPRGIRNNNPGNIRVGQPWQGLAKPSERTPEQVAETEFAVFVAPEWGIRAMARLFQAYRTKYGLTTAAEIIRKWAPPVENKTTVYINAVADSMGVSAGAELDTSDPEILRPLIKAIIQHENGQQPYSDTTIMAGIALAGLSGGDSADVSKDRSHPAESRTIQASSIQIASAVGGGWLALLQLEGPALYYALGLCTLVVVAGMVVFRERILRWADGVR